MSLFRVEGATPDENDESKEHSLAARLAAVRATAEEAQTTVDESAAQYQTLIREQVDFHANYVPAFDNDPSEGGDVVAQLALKKASEWRLRQSRGTPGSGWGFYEAENNLRMSQ